jgi:MFS family permease
MERGTGDAEERPVRSDDEREPTDRTGRRGDRRTATDGEERAGIDHHRQHERYGGFNFGAAFFGWLVAIGIAVLLTALLSAAGAAIGLTQLSDTEAEANAETLSLVGAVLLVLVLAISYYAGGYVAGRMSRFDGGRQGLGVWVLGLLVTLLVAGLGAVAGAEYNVFANLELPRIPVEEGSLTAGAAIALVAILVVTVIAAIVGGKAGERYHRRVDEAGLHHAETRT